MTFPRLITGIFSSLALCAMGQELPLPVFGQMAGDGPTEALQPTLIIKPPVSGPIVVPGARLLPEQIAAIEETERRLIEEQASRQIAEAHQAGQARELKQLIVMDGPVDASVSFAAKPPVQAEGKVALIGLKDSTVAKSVEDFFGAPLTPEREKALLAAVRQRLLEEGRGKASMDVRIAGWWPAEGVMAVSVVSKG